MLRFGPQVGAKRTGTSVYELPPGQAICPYHYEYGEEEWLLVLSGRPTLRTPDGSEQLAPWDAVHFPEGPTGAHAVRNETEDTVRVLMYSTVSPDSGLGLPRLRQDRRVGGQSRGQAHPPPSERDRLLQWRSLNARNPD